MRRQGILHGKFTVGPQLGLNLLATISTLPNRSHLHHGSSAPVNNVTKRASMTVLLTPAGLQDHTVTPLPKTLTATVTKLPRPDHRTLLKKREWLHTHDVEPPPSLGRNGKTLAEPIIGATLVFAQEEAGTAVCVSSRGFLLTCSHCVAESRDDLDWEKLHWLLFASGQVVAARTVAWDDHRDLALLLIIKASDLNHPPSFPSLSISLEPPKKDSALICIGHPGSEDLEASIPGVQTNYDSLVLSTGKFRGLAPDQDPQDNSEIGALMHDCWTYWGHSGAPLVDRKSGRLVGVHSSWDDETAMRRGVPWEAIKDFLEGLPVLMKLAMRDPGVNTGSVV